MSQAGRLILVGTPIGNLNDMSPRAVEALGISDVILCEDTRRTLQLLNHFKITGPRLVAFHEHNEASRSAQAIDAVQAGQIVSMVSDAGMPLISDPGAKLVKAAANVGLPVEVISGPTAAIHALVASGFATDRFSFEGFLPSNNKQHRERLGEIANEPRTVILYESPHRLIKTLADLAQLSPQRKVAVTRELTKIHEEIWRGTLEDAVKHINEPRGEYTLVLEGVNPEKPDYSDQVLTEALQGEVATGKSKRDAVEAVSTSFNVPRDRVYKLSIDL